MKVATTTSNMVDYSSPVSSDRQALTSSTSVVRKVIEPYTNKQGHKIQARSLTIYNAIVPTRDEVRKINYDRRHGQMTGMGFRTPINVPYKLIGDPIHLDSRQFSLYDPRQHVAVNYDKSIKPILILYNL